MRISFRFLFASALAGLGVAAASAAQRIVVIGDSTVCDYADSKYPWAGWGQVLSLYFQPGSVTVRNDAIGGRSTRSFIEGGRWATTLAALQKDDILLVQFGHNDRDFSKEERYTDTAAYKKYLAQYANEARAKGAHPVFVTPMNMNTWNGSTVREVFTEGANNYRAAMIHAAASLKVPVLDLEQKSKRLMDTLGAAYMGRFHFLGLDPGEYPNYPTGSADGTHFQELGALENARMVVEEIARQSDDSILKRLAPLVSGLATVVVKTDLSTKDTLTRTRTYPAGATVTLKVKSFGGKRTFRFWADETGRKLTDSLRCRFVADGKARTITAIYSPNASGAVDPVAREDLRMHGRILSGLGGEGATIFDLAGHRVAEAPRGASSLDLARLPRGAYWVRDVGPEFRLQPIALGD